ncbi:hypothetical protein A2960_06105 [Candidatus Gottesmanbacteria bacterium RIFCSPLOWO2_01_FULL_39_12b]|uniref:PIN domain-containing protein n=1 Tax=Candidatus Gottesmanbacteria bacterium RIFCSPLOWO2_01_FULL_39_12b TaxID=1798388 RepID=A0A1F6APK8_9BACT|nr:MAG: hypothetical protein A2960_06105 [Candidatus Gottesmanbacteria bacterium RIFCSPLOWO2_01_FULL_39_12b]
MEVVIDTHALIWYLTADKKLSKKAKHIIEEAIKDKRRLIVSVMVLLEVLVLVEKKKLKFTWEEFNHQISEFPNLIIYPIGLDVLEVMKNVGEILELHDRILVATAIIHKAVIISRDPEISSVREVETIW